MSKGKKSIKKDNSSKILKIEANKLKRHKKFQDERLQRALTHNPNQKELDCKCGKKIKIRNYKLKGDSYTCCDCRNPKKEDLKNEETNNDKSVSQRHTKRKDSRTQNSRGRTFRK